MIENSLRSSGKSRAWVEIDLDALAHNASQLRKLLPSRCKLMAIVKTDAYGHGYERVAQRLQKEGIRSYAVATIDEGSALREAGILGDILVLGYTAPEDADVLAKHSMAQLVISGAHAAKLNATGLGLQVHVAIDTGLHRLGVDASDIDELESIFACNNLTVVGTATHLASCDSLDETEVSFTNEQLRRFFSAVDALNSRGCNTGDLHVQSSFGIANYPAADYAYARAGIMLYGVKSTDTATKAKIDLRPVLSLRAVIAQVRQIGIGESAGYGRLFTADRPTKLATVCIGYADGVPRQLSGPDAACLVNGQRVPIVGRISMDMLMVDTTDIAPVKTGDVATLIGRDGAEIIRCEDFATAAGTITNDILCGLGGRLERIYFD